MNGSSSSGPPGGNALVSLSVATDRRELTWMRSKWLLTTLSSTGCRQWLHLQRD